MVSHTATTRAALRLRSATLNYSQDQKYWRIISPVTILAFVILLAPFRGVPPNLPEGSNDDDTPRQGATPQFPTFESCYELWQRRGCVCETGFQLTTRGRSPLCHGNPRITSTYMPCMSIHRRQHCLPTPMFGVVACLSPCSNACAIQKFSSLGPRRLRQDCSSDLKEF